MYDQANEFTPGPNNPVDYHSVRYGPIRLVYRKHCILVRVRSWPHRAVVAGLTVASVFLEGTWNTRRVLFSGFCYVLRMSRASASRCVFCRSGPDDIFHVWILELITVILEQCINQQTPPDEEKCPWLNLEKHSFQFLG